MNLKKRKQEGFTMIEIMVVVVIVAILAVISLPIYLRYVESSYATEARTIMSTLEASVDMYRTSKGTFPSDIDELERAGLIDIKRSTKLKWNFELALSDGGGTITATSTDVMGGGAGKVIVYDTDLGKFRGYGSPEGE